LFWNGQKQGMSGKLNCRGYQAYSIPNPFTTLDKWWPVPDTSSVPRNPQWLRLKRIGSLMKMYYSRDGANFNEVDALCGGSYCANFQFVST
jgi:hypothetical protein